MMFATSRPIAAREKDLRCAVYCSNHYPRFMSFGSLRKLYGLVETICWPNSSRNLVLISVPVSLTTALNRPTIHVNVNPFPTFGADRLALPRYR
jgi:hypothetical protein